MDRDNHWERTQQAYDALVWGQGVYVQSAKEAIQTAYKVGQSDEFIPPTVVVDKSRQPIGKIEDSDAIVFFNFRADRARQLNAAFTQRSFSKFPIAPLKSLFFVAFTLYENGNFIEKVAYPPVVLKNTLSEVISKAGFAQFHIAETEKYAHVTYFFNGGREVAFPKEARTVIPSPRVATYDIKPEMSAYEIAIEASKRIKEKKYTFILINFANCDMVGHTGNLAAAIKGVETIDKCLGQLYHEVLNQGGIFFVTADHGNAEEMINPQTDEIEKDHTTNPVPFIVASSDNKKSYPKAEMNNLLTSPPAGILGDVAPSALDTLSLPKPKDMEGTSLIDSM
jgi:2,3-bisphosphoglycerate-independent phosphoglycerate mutase